MRGTAYYICVGTLTALVTPGFAQTGASVWDLNGSEMDLTASGADREIRYRTVRPGLQETGVKPGTLWFKGVRSGDQYTGMAYVFSESCGAIAYAVVGSVSADGKTITVQGSAPTVEASDCAITSSRDTTDALRLLQSQNSAVLQDHDYGEEGRLFSSGQDDYFLLSRTAHSGEDESGYVGQVRVRHTFTGGGYEILMKDYSVACTSENAPTVTWFQAGDHSSPVTVSTKQPEKRPPADEKESYNLYWAACRDKFEKFR